MKSFRIIGVHCAMIASGQIKEVKVIMMLQHTKINKLVE